jgi:hypothetical protein
MRQCSEAARNVYERQTDIQKLSLRATGCKDVNWVQTKSLLSHPSLEKMLSKRCYMLEAGSHSMTCKKSFQFTWQIKNVPLKAPNVARGA